MKTSTSLSAVLSLIVAISVNAFVPTQTSNRNTSRTKRTAVKTKLVDEAISIYNSRYANRGEYKVPFYSKWGVPRYDVDGTPTSNSNPNTSQKNTGKRLFDVDSKKVRAAFDELSKVYSAEEALQMTKAMPSILAFDKTNFKPTLVEFGKVFGEGEAKDMVVRNPGLLAVKPSDAAKVDDQTMQFSYIVAITRPVGGLLLYGTFGLLMIPVVEGISGVPFRENILQSIFN
eukprot:CAMPEP_0198270374 /NCGR_PEP_ID=MMETSP1447-20131203/44792_1 /TAXON_ID=420782 /ORGANISM="Chaetoceros dichaeta, Strain CCMP1751" /LENGTH=229 /DNA_ID=CAMNT_0043962375 /DNA_START=167 /DNA_END=856 /DNA_ORIENTATION=-